MKIAVHRFFVAALYHSPDWVLHALNKGRKTIAGRTLDPRIRLIERAVTASQAGAAAPSVEESRAATRSLHVLFAPARESGVDVSEDVIQQSAGRSLRVRIYRCPNRRPPESCIVYAHFGGGVVGSLDTCDWFCSLLAKRTGADVVSVDYRLAPEHRFPAGIDDVLCAYRWARSSGMGGAGYRVVAIAGDSIGGAFAAAVAVVCARQGGRRPDLQLLIYPALDFTRWYTSQELFEASFPLDGATAAWFREHYLPAEVDVGEPRLSPGLYASDGAGTTALIVVAGHDVLADQATVYADALRHVGGRLEVMQFDSLCHGFTTMARLAPAAREACERIARRTAELLNGCTFPREVPAAVRSENDV